MPESEYLTCEGLLRAVVFRACIDWRSTSAAAETREGCIRKLTDLVRADGKEQGFEPSADEIEAAIGEAIERKWCKWVETDSEIVLHRTKRGEAAWDGPPPCPTINTADEGIRVVLGLLLRVNDEWWSTLKGDPRLKRSSLKDDDELRWVSHLGVSSEAYLQARDKAIARVYVVSSMGWLCNLHQITSDGEAELKRSQPGTPQLPEPAIASEREDTDAAAPPEHDSADAVTDAASETGERPIKKGAAAELPQMQQTTQNGTGEGASKKVQWNEGDSSFITAKDAVSFGEGNLNLSRLSKLLRPDGPIRYMRNGRRCMVHAHDFLAYIKQTKPSEFTDEVVDEYLKGVEQRKAAADRDKQAGK